MSEARLPDSEIARLREMFAQVPYARLLGIELIEAERGAASLALGARPELTRMRGIIHGGAIASLADTAAAFAVLTLLEAGQGTVTVDLTIHYLRPVSQGRIEARARVLREGRRLVIIGVEVTDHTGVLTATATTTYVKQARRLETPPQPS